TTARRRRSEASTDRRFGSRAFVRRPGRRRSGRTKRCGALSFDCKAKPGFWGIGFGFEFVLRFVKVRRPAGIVSENGNGFGFEFVPRFVKVRHPAGIVSENGNGVWF